MQERARSKREWKPRHTKAYPVAQVGLEVCVALIPLPQPSECKSCRHEPPYYYPQTKL